MQLVCHWWMRSGTLPENNRDKTSLYILSGQSRRVLWTVVSVCLLAFIVVHLLPLGVDGRLLATWAFYAGFVVISGFLIWKDSYRSPFCNINFRTRLGWQLTAAAIAPLVVVVVPFNFVTPFANASLVGLQCALLPAMLAAPDSLSMVRYWIAG